MNNRAPQAVPAQLTESKATNLFRELFTGNKRLVLDAFDTLFSKRDYGAAEKFWSPLKSNQRVGCQCLARNFHFEHGFGCSRKADP